MVVCFEPLIWVLDNLDDNRLGVRRLDQALRGRRVGLPGKVGNCVKGIGAGLDLGGRRWEELELDSGSGHGQKSERKSLPEHGPMKMMMALDMEVIERLRSSMLEKQTVAFHNATHEEKERVSSTVPAWTCQTERKR